MEKFQRNIKLLRVAQGMNQTEFSRFCGLPGRRINSIESGVVPGNMRDVTAVSEATGHTIDDLIKKSARIVF